MHPAILANAEGRLFEAPEETVEKTPALKLALIVEDDLALRPIWEKAFAAVGAFKVDWATSRDEAEKLIRHRYKNKEPYDLVVADIVLEGEGSGIDLWNRYGEEAQNFVFVSAQPLTQSDFLKSLNYGLPEFVKKPLTPAKCRQIVETASKYTKKKGGQDDTGYF